MIAYFDTSAVIPLVISEPTSAQAQERWRASERAASARIVYAEGHAALAHAARIGRIAADALPAAISRLLDIYDRLEILEISDVLVRRAGALAELHALRGYDLVHLAAADLIREAGLVFVAGDEVLCDAAETIGLDVARTGGQG